MATKQMSIVIQAIDQMSGPFKNAALAVVGGIGLINNAFTKVGGILTKVSGVAQRAISILKSVLTAPGDSPLIRGIESLFGGVSTELDAIAKASRRLGIATETLSELRYAAKLSNIEFGSLADAAATAQRNISQFATFGSGKARESLTLLNLQLKDQYGRLRNIGDLLPEIADRLKSLPLEQRGLAAKGLFGDQAQPFLNLLENGRGGLAGAKEGAARTGVIFTREQTEAIEKYNDAVTRVGEAWLGVKAKIAVDVAPYIEGFLNRVADRLADLPAKVKILGQTLGDVVSLDPDRREQGGARMGRIIQEAAQLAKVSIVELLKFAGQALLNTMIVAAEVFGPLFGEIITDTVGAFINKNTGVNIITLSLRGQLKESKRLLAEDLQAATRELAVSQARLRDNLLAKENTPEGRALSAQQSGANYSERVEAAQARVFAAQEKLIKARSDLVNKEREIVAADEDFGKRRAETIAASYLSIKSAGESAIETIREQAARLNDVVDESGFVGPLPMTQEAAQEAVQSMGGFGDAAGAVMRRIAEYARSNLISPLGRSIDVLKRFAVEAKAAGQFLPELRARQALLRGDEDRAALIRFDAQQQAERAGIVSQLPAGLRAQTEALLDQERRQFEAKLKVASVVKQLVSSYEAYRDQLERTSDLVETGELKQFQATRQNQQAASAVRELGEQTRASLTTIKAEYADLPDVTAGVADQVKEIMRVLRPSTLEESGTFGGGFMDGLREIAREFQDLQQSGKSFAQSVAGSLRDELGTAIFEIGQRFKDVDKIAQRFFANLFASIGRAASNKLAEGLLGAVFKGIGISLGAASGGVITPLGIQRYAGGGIIPPGEDTIIGVRYGEGVLRQQAMRSIGIPKFHELNQRGAAALGNSAGGGRGGNVVINMPVTINGAQNPAAIRAELDRIPRQIVEALRQSPAYRGDMRSALDGA